MKLEGRKCVKCPEEIITPTGRPKHNYNEQVFDLDNGSDVTVGVCAGCSVEESEWPALLTELKKYGCTADTITLMKQRLGFVDVLKATQGNKCAKCDTALGSTWVATNGELRCEGC